MADFRFLGLAKQVNAHAIYCLFNFNGILVYIKLQDMTEEEIKTLFFASKEINSNFTGLEVFNVITLCTLEYAAAVYKLMQSTFDSAEQVFVCKQGQVLESLTGICIQYTILYSCFTLTLLSFCILKLCFLREKQHLPQSVWLLLVTGPKMGLCMRYKSMANTGTLCFALLKQMLGAKS